MKVFDFRSYKTFLKAYIEATKRRGVISELAEAAGCTHSYLSQVLNGKPELTPDQAWSLADHLSLSKEESDYFFFLVLSERAVSPKLKKELDSKLKSLKTDQLTTSKAVSKSTDHELGASQRDRYYSSWTVGAIHSLTACSDYQTVDELAERLNLSPLDVENTLTWLLENGLVNKSGDRFLHSGQNIHLSTESVHNQINHLNWRLRAIQSSSKKENIHYTSSFTISRHDWDILRASLVEYLERQRKDIQSSGAEEGYIFCCDLFKI